MDYDITFHPGVVRKSEGAVAFLEKGRLVNKALANLIEDRVRSDGRERGRAAEADNVKWLTSTPLVPREPRELL